MTAPDEIHPVQVARYAGAAKANSKVTLRAYEVYCEVHGPQPAIVDLTGRNCRGGFSAGELIALLYAHSFPKAEWTARVDEAFRGMENL